MQAILTPADIAECKQRIQQCETGKQICQKGARCGFDLTGQEATLQSLQDRLMTVLNEFAPKGISAS